MTGSPARLRYDGQDRRAGVAHQSRQVLDRQARGVRRRVVRLPDRVRWRGPDRRVHASRGRRPSSAATDPLAAIRRDDDRPVPAPWRRARGRLARRPRWCGRCRLSRGRRWTAPDRLEPAGRRHPSRPRPLGAPRGVRPVGRRPVRPASAGAVAARCGGGHRRHRGDGARRPARAQDPAQPPTDRRSGPRPAFVAAPTAASIAAARELRERLGLGERYLVFTGRFDARLDLTTLLSALGALAGAGRPAGLADDVPWPPRVLLVGASPDDRASVARAATRHPVGDSLAYAPGLPVEDLAGLVAAPGRRSCPSCPRRPGCRSSRPSRRGRRSSRRRSGRSPSWSVRPACSSSRATWIGWPSPSPPSGPMTASTTGSPPSPESAPARVADVGRRGRRDPCRLRRGRHLASRLSGGQPPDGVGVAAGSSTRP